MLCGFEAVDVLADSTFTDAAEAIALGVKLKLVVIEVFGFGLVTAADSLLTRTEAGICRSITTNKPFHSVQGIDTIYTKKV